MMNRPAGTVLNVPAQVGAVWKMGFLAEQVSDDTPVTCMLTDAEKRELILGLNLA
jgi:hypothetical protein